MLTRRIDAALDALAACRAHAPGLRERYRPGSAERAALDGLLAALASADAALARRPAADRPVGDRR